MKILELMRFTDLRQVNAQDYWLAIKSKVVLRLLPWQVGRSGSVIH